MYIFSDNEIKQSLVGPLISVNIVKQILADSKIYVNGSIDTERFSEIYHQILDAEHVESPRENSDWACGYLTADRLNSIINDRR